MLKTQRQKSYKGDQAERSYGQRQGYLHQGEAADESISFFSRPINSDRAGVSFDNHSSLIALIRPRRSGRSYRARHGLQIDFEPLIDCTVKKHSALGIEADNIGVVPVEIIFRHRNSSGKENGVTGLPAAGIGTSVGGEVRKYEGAEMAPAPLR